MREDTLFRAQAHRITHCFEKEDYISVTGITGASIFSVLKCLDFPNSFMVDFMHLFFEKVVGLLVNHWRGRFFIPRAGNRALDTSSEDEETQQASRKRRRGDAKGAKLQKFEQNHGEYCIPPRTWTHIGDDMRKSKRLIPASLAI